MAYALVFHFHSSEFYSLNVPVMEYILAMAPHQPCLCEIQLISIAVCVSLLTTVFMHLGNIFHLGSIPECTG